MNDIRSSVEAEMIQAGDAKVCETVAELYVDANAGAGEVQNPTIGGCPSYNGFFAGAYEAEEGRSAKALYHVSVWKKEPGAAQVIQYRGGAHNVNADAHGRVGSWGRADRSLGFRMDQGSSNPSSREECCRRFACTGASCMSAEGGSSVPAARSCRQKPHTPTRHGQMLDDTGYLR